MNLHPASVRFSAGFRVACTAACVTIAVAAPALTVDLTTLQAPAGSVFTHPFIGNVYGRYPVSGVGDFNGDGLADFAVGFPETRVAGNSNAGRVALVYGSGVRPMGFSLADLATSTSKGFRIDGDTANGHLGTEIIPLGDVNADGYSDFSMSSGNDGFVFLGGKGPRGNISIADLPSSPTLGFTIHGTLPTSTNSLGDVNGDGYDDILAYSTSMPFQQSETRIAIIFGKANPTSIDLSTFSGNGEMGFLIRHPWDFRLGRMPQASAPCDFNGDGYDDIILGGYLATFYGSSGMHIIVMPGRATGFQNLIIPDRGPFQNFPPAPADLTYFQLQPNDPLTNWAHSWGCSGDFNGDGKSDIFVGSTVYDEDGRTSAGKVHIMFGRTITPGAIPMSLADASTADVRILGATNDNIGYGITAAGDLNNDGKADLLLRTAHSFPGTSNTQSVFALYGRDKASGDIDLAGPLSPAIGTQVGPVWGKAWIPMKGAGDVDGDGFGDFLLTTTYPDPEATYLLYGAAPVSAITAWGIY